MSETPRPNHGGDLSYAKQQYPQLASSIWQDLSTGISPWSWPVPQVPTHVWQRLPESDKDAIEAASRCFSVDTDFLRVGHGTQAFIEAIPRLISKSVVAVPEWGYQEHRYQWSRAGHQLLSYQSKEELLSWVMAGKVNVAIVINPNNPTAESFERDTLVRIHQTLKLRDDLLIVDEAFFDEELCGDLSMIREVSRGSLVVLKSLGKFFGLAGVRIGFAAMPPSLQDSYDQHCGLWAVSSPALWIAQKALNDLQWQQQQRSRLQTQSNTLAGMLGQYFDTGSITVSHLFCSVFQPQKESGISLRKVHELCAGQGLWLRYFEPRNGVEALRIGVCDDRVISRLRMAFDDIFQDAKLTRFLDNRE